jgi:hypothetical protein
MMATRYEEEENLTIIGGEEPTLEEEGPTL